MVVILTEKSSACQNFAKALGGMNGNYNGEEYKLVHSHGHLFELADPALQKNVLKRAPSKDKEKELEDPSLKKWDLDSLPWDYSRFTWSKVMKDGNSETLKKIKDEVKGASEVVIATDDDPSGEGELLAWEILSDIGWRGKTSRMYFEDESPKEIQKAFKKRVLIESMDKDGDYIKAITRERFDFLSMQLTRIATIAAKRRGVVVRQGRLKSVMVYLIGEQLDKYNNYKKVPFFEARFKDENGNIYKREESEDIRFPNKDDVDLSPYHPSGVIVDSKEIKKTAPGKLLDLASISAIVSTKGYKPKEVADTYQKMYQDHILSYPRTEDKYITLEQFNELLPLADDIANLVGVSPSLLTHKEPRKTHIKSGMAHGANRPGTNVPESLDELKKYGRCARELYTLVAKNYLAMLGEDYEYEQQKGHIKDYPDFKGQVNIPKKMGFKEIFDAEDKQDETKPLGKEGEPFVYEGCNPRPQRPTIKWLVKKLEKYNVGTGATRTQTIADISEEKDASSLVENKNGVLSLTEVGDISYKLLEGTSIASVEITEKLFESMKLVGEFKRDPDAVISGITPLVSHDKEIMMKNAVSISPADNVIGKCPLCGGDIRENNYGYGCSNWKEKDCKFTIWKTVAGKKLSKDDVISLLQRGETGLLTGFKSKSGSLFDAKLKMDESGNLGFVFPERKTIGKCPKCGKPIIEGKKGFGCSGYKEGCDFVIWKEIAGHKLKEDEIKDLLESGKTKEIDGFISKKGTSFSAALKLDQDNKVTFDFNDKGSGKKLGRCPCCGSDVVEGPFAYSCTDESGTGCDFKIWRRTYGRTLSFDEAKTLLEEGETEVLDGFPKKAGGTYSAKLKFDNDNNVTLEFVNARKETSFKKVAKCPVCGKDVLEHDKFYGCSGYSDGCSFSLAKTICKKKITPSIAKKIIEEGSSGMLSGLVSKKGNRFSAELVLNDDGSISFQK